MERNLIYCLFRIGSNLREGKVFRHVCHSVQEGFPCDRYPWCIGHLCTGTLQTRSNWMSLCRNQPPPCDPPAPPPLDMFRLASYRNASSCFNHSFVFICWDVGLLRVLELSETDHNSLPVLRENNLIQD